jgi:hypothetical protein
MKSNRLVGLLVSTLFVLTALPVLAAEKQSGAPISLGTDPATPSAVRPAAGWPGPDGFGYTGSLETFNWIDITATGIPITGWTALDDGFAGPFDIGFGFPFYGATWTRFYVGTNGFLSLESSDWSLNQSPLPEEYPPNNLLAILWDDLNLSISGSAYYQAFQDCPLGSGPCLVVEYKEMAHYAGSPGDAGTWEGVLFPSGNVLLQFLDAGAESGSGSTTGIEGDDADGDHGLTYACDTPRSLADGLALQIHYPVGVYLMPENQMRYGCAGDQLAYDMTLCNDTGFDGGFDLTYSAAWPTAGPESITAANGTCVDFAVEVSVPCDGEGDSAAVLAEGNGYSAAATLHSHVGSDWNEENEDLGSLPGDRWGMGYAQRVWNDADPQLWLVGGVYYGSISATSQYYDVNTGTWQDGGTLAHAAVYRTSAMSVGNEIVKLGGLTGGFNNTGVADVQVMGTGWQAMAAEPLRGRMDSVVASWGGKVWSLTGYDGYAHRADVRAYDPVTGAWTVIGTPPPFGANYARSGCQHGSKVYMYGDTAAPDFTGLWSYDMLTTTWTQEQPAGTPPLYSGIWAPAWVHDGETGLCYLTGGATIAGTGDLATVYVYDPVNNAWLDPLPEFATARGFHAAFIYNRPSDGHKLLCVAGGNGSDVSLSSTQCLDMAGCPACGLSLHAGDIQGTFTSDPYGRPVLRMLVLVHDADHSGVGDVSVLASIWWPEGGPVQRERMTQSTGWARFHWGSATPGTWQLCVDDLVKVGFTYEPDDNDVPNCRQWDN